MSDSAEYLLVSAAWSMGGLAVGYTLGRIDRDLNEIKKILRSFLSKEEMK